MTREEALEFLRANQPFPTDRELTGEEASQLDEARKVFLVETDAACVPLFLGVFGRGDGHGVYQLLEDTLALYPADVVVPALAQALSSEHASVRYWACQIASRFPSNRLLLALASALTKGDFDTRYAAVTALETIGGPEVKTVLLRWLPSEREPELRRLIQEVLGE